MVIFLIKDRIYQNWYKFEKTRGNKRNPSIISIYELIKQPYVNLNCYESLFTRSKNNKIS